MEKLVLILISLHNCVMNCCCGLYLNYSHRMLFVSVVCYAACSEFTKRHNSIVVYFRQGNRIDICSLIGFAV